MSADSEGRPTTSGHSHSHGHSHGHHHHGGSWDDWKTQPALRLVLLAVAVAAVATVIGAFALWPDGNGRRDAVEAADQIGLVTDSFAATVTSVTDDICSFATADDPVVCRTVSFRPSEGPDAGSTLQLPEFSVQNDRTTVRVDEGDKIIVGYEPSTDFYFFTDRDRRTPLLILGVIFVGIVVAFARVRGILALLAMAVTVLVLIAFVAPSVLDGHDPVLVSIVAASAIAFVSLYLTHGFSPTTTVALAGTLGALALTFALSWVFFRAARFSGLATEEQMVLPFLSSSLNLSGLLLGGAVLGALGALDDVTVTQVATVAEMRQQNAKMSSADLVASGVRIGREHIASTVNTLLLAYAGAAMPLLLVVAVASQPLDIVANSELIAVEIVRTLCGSIGLIAAVPITTVLAVAVLPPATDDAPIGSTPAKASTGSAPALGSDGSVAPPVVNPTHGDDVLDDSQPQWGDFAPRGEDFG